MAVVENLDIVLGAKTQQADAAIRNSVNEVRAISTEVNSLNNSMAAFEPITVAVTTGISDIMATIPGVATGIQVFQSTAAVIQAIFAARQAAGAQKLAKAIGEVQEKTKDATKEIRIMGRELEKVSDSADDIIDVEYRVVGNDPRIGTGNALIPRPAQGPTGLIRSIVGQERSIDAQREHNKAIDESLNKTRTLQSTWAAAGTSSRVAMVAGVAGAATLAVGVGAAIAAITALGLAWGRVREQAEVIDEMADSASKLGVSVRDLSTMRLSLGESSGLDDASIDNAIQKMTLGLSDAATKRSGPLHERLSSIGLEAGELLKLGPVKAMEEIMLKTQELQSPTDQLTLAYELFGKQGAALVSSLRDGPDALRDMAEWADRAGMSVSDAQAEQVGAANDAWGRLEMVATGAFRQIAAESSPVLQAIFESITEGVIGFSGYLKHLPAIVDNTVYFAGVIYDVYELSQALQTTLRNIVTLNWSEVGEDIESAFSFDTGRKNMEAIQKARDEAAEVAAAKEKNRSNNESEFAAYEAQKQAAQDAANAAKEAAQAEKRAGEERARAAQQAEASIKKKFDSIRQEIEIQKILGSMSAKQAEEREQEIRERVALHAELRSQGMLNFQQIDALADQANAMRKANDERKRLESRAEELTKQFNPAIQLRETIAELQQLFDQGLIDSATLRKASVEAVQKDSPEYRGAVSAQAGSVEAYKLLLDRENNDHAEKIALRRLSERQVDVSQDILAAIQGIQTIGRAR